MTTLLLVLILLGVTGVFWPLAMILWGVLRWVLVAAVIGSIFLDIRIAGVMILLTGVVFLCTKGFTYFCEHPGWYALFLVGGYLAVMGAASF